MSKTIQILSAELNISEKQVNATVNLLNEGATVPFISRYRKEVTGNLDEVQVLDIKNGLARLTELEKRKETIIKAIEEQGALTDELKRKIEDTFDSNVLEDIYLPYKKKKKTKATVAKENGLEPLAKMLMTQKEEDVERLANRFVGNKVSNIEDALQGARDIIAEWISEKQYSRNKLRNLFKKQGVITSKLVKGKEEEAQKFKDYFDYTEPVNRVKSHRLLALLRGEKEGFLRVKLEPNEEEVLEVLNERYANGWNESSTQVKLAIKDSYKRLLKPSIETEIRNELKAIADEQAIHVFSENLRQLLLTAPVGEKRILAIDPGYRTGCKVVCLSETGDLLNNETIYPHPPQKDVAMAIKKIASLVERYKIQVIAIGNGTASRETEFFIKNIKFDRKLQVFVVSEDGASIYSASKVAREEFPQYDVTVRGAVSIGRRLMDPLAELVKIDAKSIGVGQYQHDVDQKKLKESLDDVVISCVNKVGVNINTASKYLLSYVSGLGEQLASNIIEYRNENGNFKSRAEIKKVKRMGEKAFEQSAGFLRIIEAKNPLDNSAVHPESYYVIKNIAKDLKCEIKDLIGDDEKIKSINITNYIDEKIGANTLKDILSELSKPGRDPREKAKLLEFSNEIRTIEDVKTGMILPGIITNVTNFGCFVDVGVKENGLVHISNLSNEYVSDPSEVVKLHQHVEVKVIEVDVERKRIGLSLAF